VKIIKPTTDICLKCHDNSYRETANEWRTDIQKLIKDAENELKDLKTAQLSDEGQTLVTDTKKLVNDIVSHPSIYVHNYDLLSSLLSEKIKNLKKLK
jgi:hypothetical protein